MAKSLALDEIVKTIRRLFHDGPPNGWLLRWDQCRHFALISVAAAPHHTTNNTSFDYGFCNWFEVRIDSGKNDRYWTLTIKLSFVVPTYSIHWTYYEGRTHGRVLPIAPKGYLALEDKVRKAVEDAGFFELPDEWHEQEIEGLILDLSGAVNVTVSKCLFTDYAGEEKETS